jgi:hypothetical protein
MMNKSPETSQPTKRKLPRAVKRGLAGAALTVTAALAPAVATAQAEKGVVEKLHSYIPTRVLEKQAKQRLRNQQDLGAFNGVLLLDSSYNNGGTPYSSTTSGGASYPNGGNTTESEVIEHPVVVFRGNPKDEFGHDNLTNGDYAFGEIDRPTGNLKLINFDPATMKLVPWSMENGPLVKNFIFQSDKAGNLNLNEPLTSSDERTKLHGGPLTDASGQPWQVGLEVQHPKG